MDDAPTLSATQLSHWRSRTSGTASSQRALRVHDKARTAGTDTRCQPHSARRSDYSRCTYRWIDFASLKCSRRHCHRRSNCPPVRVLFFAATPISKPDARRSGASPASNAGFRIEGAASSPFERRPAKPVAADHAQNDVLQHSSAPASML